MDDFTNNQVNNNQPTFPMWKNEKRIVTPKQIPGLSLPLPRIGVEEWRPGDDNWYYVNANDNILCSVTKWEGQDDWAAYDDYEEEIVCLLTLEQAKVEAELWYKQNETDKLHNRGKAKRFI